MDNTDNPKIVKELNLIQILASGNAYTVKELSELLDASPSSVYRYLDDLRRARLVVIMENQRYHLPSNDKRYLNNIMHLNEEEAHVLYQSVDAIHGDTLFKENLRSKLSLLFDSLGLPECTIKTKNAANVSAIVSAIKEHRQVVFHDYASTNSQSVRDRHVEPFGFTVNYAEVWCYDLDDGLNKTFKTARIGKAEVLDAPWAHGRSHRMGHTDVFRMTGYDRHHVRLRLGVMAYSLLIEEYPLAERDTQPLDATHWLLDTFVADYRGVGRFVIGLASDIEIVDSPELVSYIKDYNAKNLANI